ncbi:hypothetical protein SCD_n00236 [Sulfuricella denitrificans skB26]|uniref:Uncharacterized protein n=1 Tax=Sulfuricella denitrificans (strain DSM 22764 / NBRC 105220 / skB26) TaxID=1163617 RepID=S6A9G8_SULDS|nr:hypothetical protein [Sulfuricella denitrificans]BAN34085.1 hypothetical protein SCD_n00236 [Sulfuricella denitrificans skB26]
MSIPYSKDFVKELTTIIKSEIGAHLQDGVADLKSRQNKRVIIPNNAIYVEIARNNLTDVFEDKSSPRPLIIMPFIFEPNNPQEVAIWLGFVARFENDKQGQGLSLISISISLIRGSQTKSYILRAEWDSRSIANADHAQPHWHAIPGRPLFDDPSEGRWSNVQSNLHLAMCAKWRAIADEGNFSHAHQFQEKDVISWVTKTLKYARGQMEQCLKNYPMTENVGKEMFF